MKGCLASGLHSHNHTHFIKSVEDNCCKTRHASDSELCIIAASAAVSAEGSCVINHLQPPAQPLFASSLLLHACGISKHKTIKAACHVQARSKHAISTFSHLHGSRLCSAHASRAKSTQSSVHHHLETFANPAGPTDVRWPQDCQRHCLQCFHAVSVHGCRWATSGMEQSIFG